MLVTLLHIVHFAKFYYPYSGGIESVTRSIANGARSSGRYSISVVCFEKNTQAFSRELVEGIDVLRCPVKFTFFSQPFGLRYLLSCFSQAKRANIVHLHAPNFVALFAAFFLKFRNKKLLIHWHSDVLSKGLLGKVLRPFEFAMLRRANGIVATSQIYMDASITLEPFKEKITVVPIGVTDASQGFNASLLPTKLDLFINGRKTVLAVGRFVRYKGLDVLIRAAQKLNKDSVLVIVGDGPLQQELQQAIVHFGVEDCVMLAGRLSDTTLHTLFKRAALYCLPSTYRAEAFGVVLLEAMTYGLPIVASDIPGSGVPWINQHGITGFNVPVGDAPALANAINKILVSEELREKFSRGARERYLSEFTEQKSVDRILDVYEKLFAGNNNKQLPLDSNLS